MSERRASAPQQEDHPVAPPEARESLWLIAAGPTLWAVHFVLSYATAAVWCARAGRAAGLAGVQWAVAGFTIAALVAVALVAWRGWRYHRLGTATAPHDADTGADRHRFLGYSTLMLCGLSFVAILYVALPVLFIRSCQ